MTEVTPAALEAALKIAADGTDTSGTVLHLCDHETAEDEPHFCQCALNRDHTGDEYDDWLEGK